MNLLVLSLSVHCLGSEPGAGVPQSPTGADARATEAGWRSQVLADVHRAEYDYRPMAGESGVWSAPNRQHDLRSRVSPAGLEVCPRTESVEGAQAPWRLHLRTTSFGREGGVVELLPATATVEGRRVELDHGLLTEWFVNDERGIEQGWTIGTRPDGVAALWIGLDFGGGLSLRIDDGGRSGVLVDSCGDVQLRYRDLLVFDARGRELEARLRSSQLGIGIWIDDVGAAYPVTVDPVLTGPTWTAESNQPNAQFGISVAAAGDVDGDGYSDVIVGAFQFDSGEADEGRAFLYRGSPSGLSMTSAWTAESDQAGAHFGWCVATAGDVNGDGYSDVLVGARFYDNGEANEGRGFLYLGSSSGLAPAPAWTAEGDQTDADFAYSLACAGDVNGDGFSDVVVGAQAYDGSLGQEGRALIYLGSGAGLAPGPVYTVTSGQENTFFGHSVATAGDVNGDGFSDVLITAPLYDNPEVDEGRVFLLLGSGVSFFALDPWVGQCDQAVANFGHSAATAGDVNGDGYSDVVVGAPLFDSSQVDAGRAFVYLGSATGLSSTAAWQVSGDQASAHFGWSVATAGDVSGDGYSDVIVGAPQYDADPFDPGDEGKAFVYLGSVWGLGSTPAWAVDSNKTDARFGTSVCLAGDVNGDGNGDVIVGAPLYSSGHPFEGRAFLYSGTPSLSTSPSWTAPGSGSRIAAAGDVDGDGYGDVFAGEPSAGLVSLYLGHSSGLSTTPTWTVASGLPDGHGAGVSSAGDVNGDGYIDVIVGAPGHSNGETYEGQALVYMGSATGFATSPDWAVEGHQNFALLGYQLSAAGDVNGDGFGDVIVGVPWYDNPDVDEGRAYVYLGSPSGLRPMPAWTAEGNQEGALFGNSVSTAGDVNGDGYDDVIIGAPDLFNGNLMEGRAYVFLGSASGLPANPSWTVESNQDFVRFGWSVATAGDVNGDGYSDVIVGAPQNQAGSGAGLGRAYLFKGSASGLSTVAAWTKAGGEGGLVFGYSVSTAGDVNGDGFDDVIVGAPGSSWYDVPARVRIFLGSGTTLSSAPDWGLEGDVGDIGQRVASAGDVNGDGRDDVVVHEFVYTIDGWLRAVQQRKKSDLASLGPLEAVGKDGVFRIRGEFQKNLGGLSWASGAVPEARLE